MSIYAFILFFSWFPLAAIIGRALYWKFMNPDPKKKMDLVVHFGLWIAGVVLLQVLALCVENDDKIFDFFGAADKWGNNFEGLKRLVLSIISVVWGLFAIGVTIVSGFGNLKDSK